MQDSGFKLFSNSLALVGTVMGEVTFDGKFIVSVPVVVKAGRDSSKLKRAIKRMNSPNWYIQVQSVYDTGTVHLTVYGDANDLETFAEHLL